jgi:acyl carrier protein
MKNFFKTLIGVNSIEEGSFKAIGGDSLAAIRLVNLFKDRLNIDLPMGISIFSNVLLIIFFRATL